MALVDNLVAYWSLDEASGDAIDARGSNDLTDNNTVGTGTGKVGNARDFESGSTEYFSRADNADLSTGDVNWTFACWVNAETMGTNAIAGKGNGVNEAGSEWLLYHDGTKFNLVVYFGSSSIALGATSFGSPSAGNWYFIVVWHDATNNQIGISINGTTDTASHSSGGNDTANNFQLGAWGGGISWDGLIDEAGFWKRVLTSDERTELYNSGNGRDYAYISGGGGGGGLSIPIAMYHYKRMMAA